MTEQPTVVSQSVDQLVERARALIATGERRLLGITGAPGSGKSTLGAALAEAMGGDAVLVGLDGFHLSNQELRRLGRADRKGAPDTFDVGGYVAVLERLRRQAEPVIYAPVFDRGIEESTAAALPVPAEAPLVIIEGNYLLVREHGWVGARRFLDEVWFVDIEPGLRRQRLVARRQSFGHSATAAAAWVETVDEHNAALVEETAHAATLLVTVADAFA